MHGCQRLQFRHFCLERLEGGWLSEQARFLRVFDRRNEFRGFYLDYLRLIRSLLTVVNSLIFIRTLPVQVEVT